MSDFVYGQFQKFVLNTSVYLPFGQVTKGTMVEFDGVRVIVNGRQEEVPSFAGAIRSGWASPVETQPVETPKSAKTVAKAATKAPEVTMPIVASSEFIVRNEITTARNLPVSSDYGDVKGVKAISSAGKIAENPTAKVGSGTEILNPTATVASGRKFQPQVTRSVEDESRVMEPPRTFQERTASGNENAPDNGVVVRNLGKPVTNIKVSDTTKVDWDLGVHVDARVKKAMTYKESDPDRFNRILNVETPEVRRILTGETAPPRRQASEGEDNVEVPLPRKISKAKSRPVVS